MRPILLKGHERSLTQVKYNREGDLIFTVSKDSSASVWYSSNGERVGTFDGHKGAIWSIDVDSKTDLAVTGSGDSSAKLWKVETGECLYTWDLNTPVRRVEFNPKNDKFLAITDAVMSYTGCIHVFPVNYEDKSAQTNEPSLKILAHNTAKFTVAGWSYNGKYIIAGHDDGQVSKYDAETGEFLKTIKAHGLAEDDKKVSVTDIQFSDDLTYFITSSKDKTAVIIDVDTFDVLKTFSADAPMNSACITPVKDFIILGGGQDARDVTTTSQKQGKFEARFYHKIFQDEIGRVKGHFGPLNYVAIHPKGTSYASGGEDGFVRVHEFDKSYFDFEYDVERTERATAASNQD